MARAGLDRFACFAVLLLMAVAHADGEANLLSMERMGAGPAAGWYARGEGYTWDAEEAPGPLGAGAARIKLDESGDLSLDSPARSMRAGEEHAACLWVRSEPAGAVVRVVLRDNDGESAAGLDERIEATGEWQRMARSFVPARGLRDRYYLELRVSGGARTVWLDGLWLGEHDGPVDDAWQPLVWRAGLALRPESAWGLVAGDAPQRVEACVAGLPGEGRHLRVRCTHAAGGVSELEPLLLPAEAVWRGTIDIPGITFGMARVEAEVLDAAGKPLSAIAETVVARAPEPVPGPLPGSYFGAHTLLQEPDLEVARRLGFKWLRIHDASAITKWGRIEPEPGRWLWHDDQVELTRRHGFRILGMLDSSPAWESGTKEEGYFSIYGAPRDLELWRNYVRQVVGHYAGRIDDWEVWNEPWDMRPDRFFQNGSPPLYAELLKAAWEETKAVNPAATVVGVDTFMPEWEQAVLALGAYPHYDVLSWHRYDGSLQGHPRDAVYGISERLRMEQGKYGAPKPLMCSEGGLELAPFQGSFFSFADPELSGDWSLGADVLSRMYLSMIVNGNQRFFLYTLHGRGRHGDFMGAAVEPGPLLRPYHVAIAALAHFVDGARYEQRLSPAPDAAVHVFSRRDGAAVAVLTADGQDPEPLSRPLPEGVECFDRWGNPIPAPREASRSLVYVVARAKARDALLEALAGHETAPAATEPGAFTNSIAATLGHGEPALWKCLNPQASLAIRATDDGFVAATRAQLRQDAALAAHFRLKGPVEVVQASITPTEGEQVVGWLELTAAGEPWVVSFGGMKDGFGGWRLVTLTLMPQGRDSIAEKALEPVRQWEKAAQTADAFALRRFACPEPFCALSYTPVGGTFLFTRPEFHIATLARGLTLGPAARSTMTFTASAASPHVATVHGRWNVVSPLFGQGPYAFTATVLRTPDGWKVASLAVGPEGGSEK